MNRKTRRATKKLNNQELLAVVERLTRENYFLKKRVLELEHLLMTDNIDPNTGEVTHAKR